MLEKLSGVLKRTTDKIANALFLDKNLVDSIVRDLQRALIEADVNIHLVKEISDKIKKTAFDERIKELEKKEHLIKILHEELEKILGEHKELELKTSQNKVMLIGLYGSGKTTTVAKLGNYYAKRGKKVLLVGLDVHRPAAKEQLKQLAEKNNLNYFIDEKENNALTTWKNLEKKINLKKYDLILIDTAGRHTLDKELIDEIKTLNKKINPEETILVMPADIGQAAKQQAKEFKDALNITGVIITRMDSSAKGGGALTACAEIGAGVYFITTGEKISDIEKFNPEKFLSRLLGMGDLHTLLEKIKSVTDESKQKDIEKRVAQGKLTLDDVIEQIKSMNQLGGFDKLKSLIPGFSGVKEKIPEDALDSQQQKIAKWEHIVKSMTPYERENPEIFDDKKTGLSRIKRVARGAGVNNSDVRALLKQYKMLKELIKTGSSFDGDFSQGLSQRQLMKLAKKFGKKKLRF